MEQKHGQLSLRMKKNCYQQKWISGDDRPELQEWKKKTNIEKIERMGIIKSVTTKIDKKRMQWHGHV